MKKVTPKTLASFRQALGAMIREKREAKEISQATLAEMINSTQNRIPEIERGDTKNIDTYITCITVLSGQLSITWK